MASCYKNKKSKYYYITYYQDGKKKHFSLKTKNKSRADYLTRTYNQYVDKGIHLSINQLVNEDFKNKTFDFLDFLNTIQTEISGNLSKSPAWRKRQSIYMKHFRNFLERENIQDVHSIDIAAINRYKNWRLSQDSEKTGETISSKTVKDELFFLKNTLFERLVEEEVISKNPARRPLKDLRVYKTERPPFTREEIKKIFGNARTEIDRSLYKILYYSGCRLSLMRIRGPFSHRKQHKILANCLSWKCHRNSS